MSVSQPFFFLMQQVVAAENPFDFAEMSDEKVVMGFTCRVRLCRVRPRTSRAHQFAVVVLGDEVVISVGSSVEKRT